MKIVLVTYFVISLCVSLFGILSNYNINLDNILRNMYYEKYYTYADYKKSITESSKFNLFMYIIILICLILN